LVLICSLLLKEHVSLLPCRKIYVPLPLKQNTTTVSYSEPVHNTLPELCAASHSFRLHLLSTCNPHLSLCEWLADER